ncbi:MAG: HAD family hydrolase [Clostridium sp.]
MENIKAVIFDMDGVIFDTERVYLENWQKVCKKYGYNMTKELYVQVMGTGRDNVKKVFKENFGQNIPIEDMYKEKDYELLKQLNEDGVPVKEGALEVIKYLKDNNYKLAIATSAKKDRAMKHIKDCNLEEYFDCIICGEDVENKKPNPEIFLKAARELMIPKENCIVIEDSEAGIRAAYNGGIRAIHIPDLREVDDNIRELSHKVFNKIIEVIEYLN